jgi:SHS2 domain-containing protein
MTATGLPPAPRRRRSSGYRHFAHTADVGLTAWGPTLDAAFAAAVRGLVAVTYNVQRVRPRAERAVVVKGDEPARLLVGLLGEALFLEETEGFLATRADVARASDGLEARLRGEPFDPAHHARVGPEVKAITYHQISVDPGPPARVRVILDI